MPFCHISTDHGNYSICVTSDSKNVEFGTKSNPVLVKIQLGDYTLDGKAPSLVSSSSSSCKKRRFNSVSNSIISGESLYLTVQYVKKKTDDLKESSEVRKYHVETLKELDIALRRARQDRDEVLYLLL